MTAYYPAVLLVQTELSRQRRGEPGEAEGAEDRREGERLSADAADTISKINPLTIADQVSQRLKKHRKQSSAVGRGESALSGGGGGGGAGEAGEKSGAKDFGYSVIVVAGDPVKLPISFNGKGVRVVAKGAKAADARGRKASEAVGGESAGKKGSPAEGIADGDSLYANKRPKEVRVPKKYDVDPSFPVYDADFNFVPDPFNGILDERYLSKEGGVKPKEWRAPHAILARSETTACDQSWRGPDAPETTTTARPGRCYGP